MDFVVIGIVAGVAVFIIFLIWLSFFLRNRRLKKLGKYGEKKVASALRRFAGIRSYKVINDLYLPLYDKTTQIDHVLIGFFGIAVIETKNLSGEVYGEPQKKDWLHIVGSKRNTLYNPLMQNQTHIDCIRRILGQEKIYSINMESLVVFTQPKVQVYIPKGLPIITFNMLKKYLRQPRFEKDNNVDVEKLYNVLMEYKVTDKKRISEHNKNVKEMAKN